MTVGHLCHCGVIVMPNEPHECETMIARAQADSRRRQAKTRAHRRTTARWKRIRRAILERDDWTCQLRVDALCGGDATTVHIRPELAGDHDAATVDDGVAACHHCHGVVDAPRACG